MSGLYKRSIPEEEKKRLSDRAMELRKKHNLSSSVIAQRLSLIDYSHLRKILIQQGVWDEFQAYGSSNN